MPPHRPDDYEVQTAGRPLTAAQRLRIRAVLWGLLVVFACVALHLVKLQGFPDPRFLKNENFHVGEIPIIMPRGRIYDREGRILARERRAPSLFAYPRYLDNPHEAAQRLGVRLSLNEDDLITRITRRASEGQMMQEVPVKRWLTQEELESIGNLNAWGEGGLRIKHEPARYYPEGQLAAHVLGFVNREQIGSDGIEQLYNEHLRTIPGKQKSRLDGKRKLLSSLTLEYVAPEGGDDLFLTIDKPIQNILERELATVMREKQATRAMGIVMDPKTGAILALACLPAFDPNAYWDYAPELRINGAISEVFEPGSAFKIVTAAAAIENGLYTPESMINCEGGAWNAFGYRTIKDVHKMKTVTFAEAFAESSNIGIIKVARDLIESGKREELDRWIRKFGFGRKTGPDFLHESSGIYGAVEQWTKFSEISLPMGQEIAVTMPQLARAFSAIANGGYLVEPHLVERAVGQSGQTTYQFDTTTSRRIMSDQTARVMRELCYGVVEHGTGSRAAIPEYRVGGKTGTAQVARPKAEGGGYYTDRHTAVFAGFAPVADPRLCAVIVVCNPQSDIYYGGYVCGPVFRAVLRESLIHLECPQDPMEPGTFEPAPAQDVADADVLVAHANQKSPVSKPPVAIAATEEAGGELAPLPVDTPIGHGQLPNLVGLTKRQARDKLADLGVVWDSQGSGWVVVQEPVAGTPITEVPLCHLVFSNSIAESIVPEQHREAETPAKLSANRAVPPTP
ncbi:MAG: penicillin-binding transpeptidase domain-containing protein [Candidatus Hydrogenedentes bacterium]|nr:penicillin-binding transpeptidase domain-containing protein [Candidatus Hydrogenedentota bacterium]